MLTLTSDWGVRDHYLAAVKGNIISRLPGVSIVDISHSIEPFDLEQAAFVFKHCYRNFPEGTIHIISINSEESKENPHIAVAAGGQYFIGADNGFFSMIFEEEPEEVVEMDIYQDDDHFTFSTFSRFITAAAEIIGSGKIGKLGTNKKKVTQKFLFEPIVTGEMLKGMVVYIDNYDNLITNIREPVFAKFTKGKKYAISCRTHFIGGLSRSYNEVQPGELVALVNSSGLLEIAINQGSASKLLGMERKSPVIVELEG